MRVEKLSEKDRRRYAGSEALRYGLGGRSYIAKVLGCSRRTVSRGAKEVSQLSAAEVDRRICRRGAGRKSYAEQWPDIDDHFLQVLQDHTAGDPMDDKVRWTDLTLGQIAELLDTDHGIKVSEIPLNLVVRRLRRMPIAA